jgi:tetratricopeptide (TPR) repeat protein
MGPHVIVSACIIDPVQQQKDFAALTAAPRLGRAGPRGVEPPPRVDAPPQLAPEVRDAALRAAGINPAYLEQAPVLARLLFGAAISMKEGRRKDAIVAQRQACDLAASLAMHELHVFCRIALASYMSGLDMRDAAVVELRSAVEHAARHQLGLVEAQARLALGLLFAVDQRYPDAAREYTECARRAEQVDVPLIAIEAWRLAGQIALQLRDDSGAASCFREAIRIAEGSEVDIARASSAPEAARALAKRYDDKGLRAQAESLFQQADAIEHGEVGIPKAAIPQAEL